MFEFKYCTVVSNVQYCGCALTLEEDTYCTSKVEKGEKRGFKIDWKTKGGVGSFSYDVETPTTKIIVNFSNVHFFITNNVAWFIIKSIQMGVRLMFRKTYPRKYVLLSSAMEKKPKEVLK